jgi:iron-sulfur cluster assembly protein
MDCPADTGLLAAGVEEDEEFDVVPVDLIITDIAHRKLQEILNFEPGDVVLTVAIHRGGCSGYLYDMQIIDRPEGDGFQFDEIDGIPVAITDYDSSLLRGIVVNFQDSLMGGGFKIENPNADKECSCGKSFG